MENVVDDDVKLGGLVGQGVEEDGEIVAGEPRSLGVRKRHCYIDRSRKLRQGRVPAIAQLYSHTSKGRGQELPVIQCAS